MLLPHKKLAPRADSPEGQAHDGPENRSRRRAHQIGVRTSMAPLLDRPCAHTQARVVRTHKVYITRIALSTACVHEHEKNFIALLSRNIGGAAGGEATLEEPWSRRASEGKKGATGS